MLKQVNMSVEYGAPANETFKNSDGWTCTIEYKGNSMEIPFYKGSGHNGSEPELEEVLNCLFSDAYSVLNASDFEDWANELGYDTDSRQAEKIYKECLKIAEQLENVFGEDFETINELVQDY